jgi:carbonic anhydrase
MKKTMKKVVVQGLVGMMLMTGTTFSFANEAASTITADQALENLMEGNANYVKESLGKLVTNSTSKMRESIAAKQHPYAIILSCSDSRVPPEILFDKGLGEIFVVRVAGNIVSPHELGSIEYAVEHIGSPLIMVLGHERCGAVTATVEANGKPVEGNIGSLIASIAPAAATAKASGATGPALVEAACNANIENVSAEIKAKSPVIAEAIKAGHVKIVGAKYDLDSGKVELLDHAQPKH